MNRCRGLSEAKRERCHSVDRQATRSRSRVAHQRRGRGGGRRLRRCRADTDMARLPSAMAARAMTLRYGTDVRGVWDRSESGAKLCS